MPNMDTQVLGGFKTGMDRSSKRGGKDGAQRLWTLQNAYLNERGEAIPRPGLAHVANVPHSSGLYGWQGKLHVFHGEDDFVDPGNPLVEGHWVRYPLAPPADLVIAGGVPDGVIGTPVDMTYSVVGGVPPYGARTITSGALPDGLTMSALGRVTGTRTTVGTFSWTVSVTDANGTTATLDDGAVVGPAAALSLKPKIVSWWNFESNLSDQARGGNTQGGTGTYVTNATSTGKKLAEGTATRVTAGCKGFNFYRQGEYGNFAFGARLTVSKLTNVTRLLTVGTDSGTAVTGVLKIGINASGKWAATLYDSTDTAKITLASTSSAVIGTETHVGVNGVFVSAGSGMTLALVINGVQEAISINTAVNTLAVKTQFVIGTYEGTGYSPAVSEMFWAHAALSTDEWTYLHNLGNKRFYADFGTLSYGTTYDAYLASLMAAKAGGIFAFNATSGTTAVNSAPFGSIGNATLTGGAAYSSAISAPPGFGADTVMVTDGTNDRAITGTFAASSDAGGQLMNTWVNQPAASTDGSTFLALMVPAETNGRRCLSQGADASQCKTLYHDYSGNDFASSVASNAGANVWKMLTWAGFDAVYFSPIVNGIVQVAPGTYPNSVPSTALAFSVGAFYAGSSAAAAYFSRTCVLTDGNFTLPQLCQLYDLGAGLG